MECLFLFCLYCRYDCSFRKKRGCKATATVEIRYSETEDGEPVRECVLAKVSTPEVHALFHEPDRSGIVVAEIMTKMKSEVEADPNAKVGEYTFALKLRLH